MLLCLRIDAGLPALDAALLQRGLSAVSLSATACANRGASAADSAAEPAPASDGAASPAGRCDCLGPATATGLVADWTELAADWTELAADWTGLAAEPAPAFG